MEREQPEKARLKAEAFSSDVTFIIVTVTKSRGFRGFFSSPPIPPHLSMPNGPWLHVDGQHGRMAPLSHIAPVTNKRGRCHGRSVPLLRTAVAVAIVHSATAFSLLPLVAVGSAIPSSSAPVAIGQKRKRCLGFAQDEASSFRNKPSAEDQDEWRAPILIFLKAPVRQPFGVGITDEPPRPYVLRSRNLSSQISNVDRACYREITMFEMMRRGSNAKPKRIVQPASSKKSHNATAEPTTEDLLASQ
ncbi:hypothetical protein B0T09DRAFT_397217 [Sordaria sp. MPI-SDFR-AT-0083]|nr:hypothetical protein B0T09DRAFT_397217 [Sordaria sp. MPI-SDFR-AT-0083]